MVGDQLSVNLFMVTFQLMEIYVKVGTYYVKHFRNVNVPFKPIFFKTAMSILNWKVHLFVNVIFQNFNFKCVKNKWLAKSIVIRKRTNKFFV